MLHRVVLLTLIMAGVLCGTTGLAAGQTAQTQATSAASSPTTSPASAPSGLSGSSTSRPSDITAEMIGERMNRLQRATDLDEAVRKQALDLYRQALEQVRQADEAQARAAAFQKSTDETPSLLKEAQAALEQPATTPAALTPATDATLQQVEAALSRAQSQWIAARRNVNDFAKQKETRDARIQTEIPKQRQELSDLRASIQKDLAQPAAADSPAEIAVAKKMLLQAQYQNVTAQLSCLRRESSNYQAQGELLTAQQDLANIREAQAQQALAALRQRASASRREEADLAIQKAQSVLQNVKELYPALAPLAEENLNLVVRRAGPSGRTAGMEQAVADSAARGEQLMQLAADQKAISERLELAGMSQAVYMLLRRQQSSLPDVDQIQRDRCRAQKRVEEIRMELLDLDEQRVSAVKIDARLNDLLKTLSPTDRANESLTRKAASLLKDRLSAIDALRTEDNNYLTRLVDLDNRLRRLSDETRKFSRFIDERVLWVRSTSRLATADLPRAAAGLSWMLSTDNWAQVGGSLKTDAQSNWPTLLLLLVPLGLMLLRQPIILALTGRESSQLKRDSFGRDVLALILTLLVALPVPTLLAMAAWRLASAPHDLAFASAVAGGLLGVSLVFMTLEVLRQVCRPMGLAQSHFRWPKESIATLRPWLARLMFIILPLTFIVTVSQWHTDNARNISPGLSSDILSVGRIAFIVNMLVLATFCLLVLRPSGKVLSGSLAAQGWLWRLRPLWYPLSIAMPLLLAGAAVAGYFYTALHLSHRLLETVALVLGLVLMQSLLLRWVSIAFRRLAIERLRKRNEAQQAQVQMSDNMVSQKRADHATRLADDDAQPADASTSLGQVHATGQAGIGVVLRPKLDGNELKLSDVNEQSRQILRYALAVTLFIGGWYIWSSVLPALGILRSVELWSRTATVSQSVIGPDGAVTTSAVEKVLPVTLADLLLALGMAVITVAASRNLPGLLEISILRRLRWDFGARYAFITIVRYAIFVAGAVIAFSMLGVSWSKIQWLIAAITVGLGFGLQEIFANFVSGLILLFERPMRVGDMVTVGDVTGTVTKIRIRATTIRDLDRKELVVPNKEFITGKLMNWTLSDSTLRAVIPVGVNYSADTSEVLRILKGVAREHKDVLKVPPPECQFTGFGDSSLNFELDVFVKDWDTCKRVRNELQIAILQAFRQAGIDIPFPQREIHVRTLPPAGPVKSEQPADVELKRAASPIQPKKPTEA